MPHLPEENFLGSKPKKKVKKKKPTGILKDLMKLKKYFMHINNLVLIEDETGGIVKWSDVEAIINKYSNP